jgi:hypothetical protein
MKAFLNLLAALIVMSSCVWSSGIPAKADEAVLAIASRVAEVQGGQDALLLEHTFAHFEFFIRRRMNIPITMPTNP